MIKDINSPIGVFDSGIGGLTVAREIMRQLPGERIVYFGDTARVPYGSKSKETIIRYSKQIVRFLKSKQVKAIVVACNTASAYALNTISEEENIPVIGVIYAGAKTAVDKTKSKRVGVVATRATISSNVYTDTIHSFDKNIEVVQKACPLLVPLVEEGLLHDSITDEIISRYVSELKTKYIDTLILGCTHYPLLRSAFSRIMGEGVSLVNPAYETAIELKELLDKSSLASSRESVDIKEHEFYVSDLAQQFADFAMSILPGDIDIAKVQKIDIENF